MLIIKRRKILKLADIYFSDKMITDTSDVDVLYLVESSIPHDGADIFTTLHIDLSMSAQYIFSNFSKNTRYEINRAEREGCESEIHQVTALEEVNEFAEYYIQFAESKNLPHSDLDAQRLASRLKRFFMSGALYFSIAKQGGLVLCRHAYIIGSKRARLLYSASHFRNFDSTQKASIGRANRYLHWQDIKYFKYKGFSIYDFGGIANQIENVETTNIDKFKRGFGGKEIQEYSFHVPLTTLGKVFLFSMKFLKRFS